MHVKSLEISDVKLIELQAFGDHRGWFMPSYKEDDWMELLGQQRFVQDNQSFSARPGTVRGIHFQVPPFAQAKLVQVLAGEIFDVAVDLRKGSPTFGRHVCMTLKAGDRRQILVPEGFGHAFMTLVPDTLVQYKVNNPYRPESERGIAWNDPSLGIEWPQVDTEPTLSDRDQKWPVLAAAPDLF